MLAMLLSRVDGADVGEGSPEVTEARSEAALDVGEYFGEAVDVLLLLV
jgi:hypothetical protein